MSQVASRENSNASSGSTGRASSAGAASSTSALELEVDVPLSKQAALDLMVARRMFWGGFAGLPWFWFLVWIHFRHVAKLPSASPELAVYARRSGWGAVIGGILFVAWVVYVQLTWRTWSDDMQRMLMAVRPETENDEL